jgi:hypothetical protein
MPSGHQISDGHFAISQLSIPRYLEHRIWTGDAAIHRFGDQCLARLLHPESCYFTQNLAVAGAENILELLLSFICARIFLPIYFS